MAAATRQPPLPSPDFGRPEAPAGSQRSGTSVLTARTSDVSTPAFLRSWNVALLALIAAFAVVGSVAALVMRSASEATAGNTAPALIGIQDLFASVAEANTAATAAFLSTDGGGAEDRVNRNLYQDAIRRAGEQTEEVSAIIGDDDNAHRALKDITVALNSYNGQVEAARIANLNDLPGADAQLRDALGVIQDDVAPSVGTVTARGQDKLDAEQDTGRLLTLVAIGLGAITVGALLWVQRGLLKRTNRILNPLLLVATILISVALGYLIVGPISRNLALDNASTGGYDAIAATSEIQTAAFNLQSQLSLQLVEADDADLEPLFQDVALKVEEIGAGTDSAREQAAAEALRTRWQRYEEAARDIDRQADGGSSDEAIARFQDAGLSTFNGLNTAIESVLSDNRAQFSDGVDEASRAVGITPFLTIILPVFAALAVLLAIQRRLGEYR